MKQDDEGYYYNRALLFLNIGDVERALADYDAALHVNPDYALALWDKALIEADMEEFEAALEGLDRVLELSPYSAAIIYKDKGNIYYKMEEWEKSLQAFNQSLELDPYYTYAYKGRGSLYTALNRFDEAENDLLKALEYAPDDKDAMQRLEFLQTKRQLAGK